MAASAMARTCSANRPGVSSPSRTPRSPSIGFDSCSRSTAASSLRSASTCCAGLAAGLGQRDLDRQFGAVRQELVQRRVQQPDVHRQPVHRVQQLGEVLALQRQQRGQRVVALVGGTGQDDPLDQRPAVAEEHVLGAAQADALGAKGSRPDGVLGGVRVRPDRQPAPDVGVGQQPVDRLDQRGGLVVRAVQRGRRARTRCRSPPATARRASRRGRPRRSTRRC